MRKAKVAATGRAVLHDIQRRGRTCTATVHDNIRWIERQIRRNSRITEKLCSNLSMGKGIIWERMGEGQMSPFQYFFTRE
jgi:hypothetical protein